MAHIGVGGEGVTVQGAGAVDVVPDVAFADLGVESRSEDVSAALAAAERSMGRVRTGLASRGVEPVDVRTTRTSVWREERTSPDGTTLTVVAHVTLGLRVVLRDLATAGETVHAALSDAGGDARMDSLTFGVADASAAQVRARELAFADARARAEQFAALAGRELGEVAEISEVPVGGAGPLAARREAFDAASAGSVPVDGGQESVGATVTVRWGWSDGRRGPSLGF